MRGPKVSTQPGRSHRSINNRCALEAASGRWEDGVVAGSQAFDRRDRCQRASDDTCACASDLAADLEVAHENLRAAEKKLRGAENELREHREEIERLARLTEQLEQAMASRATIEQAKGIIVDQTGCDAEHAFRRMVVLSRNRNIKVRDLARAIVDRAQRAKPARSGKGQSARPA
jgi:ANTAR domain-containing protein